MTTGRKYLRFPLAYRLEHWVMVASFTTLAVTGLVQKFAQSGVSIWLIGALGGLETVRVIHRVAATVLILESIYHVGLLGYNLFVRRYSLDLMLTGTDLKNALHSFLYNLGRRKQRPAQGRYTFEEKFEYFAIIWGTIVMIVTGFVLWNPIAATSVLPGEFVPAAKAVHSGEALLAVLAIIVWHSYHVHIRKFNKSMFTGYISEADMHEEHPLELAARRQATPPPADPDRPRRRRVFLTAYGVVALALAAGLFVFITFEQTAIETIPPMETVNVFAPRMAEAAPVLVSFDGPLNSWDDGVGDLFQMKCAFCHGGRTPLAGLNLTSYDTAIIGGTTLPAITPRDPDNSGIITKHRDSSHPVTLTEDELERLAAWIAAGAPRE